jgi:hypothetical protein
MPARCILQGWLSMCTCGRKHTQVAVKVAKKDGLSRRELESFLGEVSLLARLHHRNIVQVGVARRARHRASLVVRARVACWDVLAPLS